MFDPPSITDRSTLFNRFSKEELVERYRQNYGLDTDIDWEHVEKHAVIEGQLTDLLLKSTSENRAIVFEGAYSKLYAELPWLTGTGNHSGGEMWASLMRPGSSVYEVGSGAGYLINYLSDRGYQCVGTDLSSERRKAGSSKSVIWDATDGVHLTRFVDRDRFDYVISNQVVEHLHPEDIVTHFEETRQILKEGGKYIVKTPYSHFGPNDLSKVFGEPRPVFMHLHEFNYDEMRRIRSLCGYKSVKAVFRFPKTLIHSTSTLYMKYLALLDRLLMVGSRESNFLRIIKVMRKPLWLPSHGVWVVFER